MPSVLTPSEVSGLVHEVPSRFIEITKRVAPRSPVICDIGGRDALEGIYLYKLLPNLPWRWNAIYGRRHRENA